MASRPVAKTSKAVVKPRRPLPGKTPATTKETLIDPSSTAVERVIQDYILAEEIGRGGYGAVYKAWNQRNGEVVAVKRLHVRHVEENAASIQTEINLLKKLRHPNIVEYKETIRTPDALFIVLEFVENGSLAQTLKKFGAFSETLTAVYISQVLRGLEYLHNQGVIHRDIKGPNILTTKSGVVKLADFGIATTEADKSSSVVGTPYWMAPEVIEMSGISAACDVWSVGCTVIELLTGKPPYFDLAPMTALFRIVQDDGPPIPEKASRYLRDFLAKCFKKVPSFRPSASDLLMDPWFDWALKDVQHSSAVPGAMTTGTTTVTTVGGGAGGDVKQSVPPPKPPIIPPPRQPKDNNQALLAMAQEDAEDGLGDFGEVKFRPKSGTDSSSPDKGADILMSSPQSTSRNVDPLDEDDAEDNKYQTQRVVAQTVRFRQSLMESIRLAGTQRQINATPGKVNDVKANKKGDGDVIVVKTPPVEGVKRKPKASGGSKPPLAGKGLKGFQDDDDDEDFGDWDRMGSEPSESTVKLKLPGAASGRGKSPQDAELGGAFGDEDEDWSFMKESEPNSKPLKNDANRPVNGAKQSPAPLQKHTTPKRTELAMQAMALADDEDWGDVDFGNKAPVLPSKRSSENLKFTKTASGQSTTSAADEIGGADVAGLSSNQLRARISKIQTDAGEGDFSESDEERDPFATAIMFEASEIKKVNERQQLVQNQERTQQLIEKFTMHESEATLLEACASLLELFTAQPSLRRFAVAHHAVLTFIDVLNACAHVVIAPKPPVQIPPPPSKNAVLVLPPLPPPPIYTARVVEAVLKAINIIIHDDNEMKESLAMIGIMPVVVQFGSPTFGTSVRYQVARFVEEMCSVSTKSTTTPILTFLACRGVQLLVQLLRPSDGAPALESFDLWCNEHKIALIALSTIVQVFQFQDNVQQAVRTVTKNEIYRLFLRENLLQPVAFVLQSALSHIFRQSTNLTMPLAGASPEPNDMRQLAVSTRIRASSDSMKPRHTLSATATSTAGSSGNGNALARVAWDEDESSRHHLLAGHGLVNSRNDATGASPDSDELASMLRTPDRAHSVGDFDDDDDFSPADFKILVGNTRPSLPMPQPASSTTTTTTTTTTATGSKQGNKPPTVPLSSQSSDGSTTTSKTKPSGGTKPATKRATTSSQTSGDSNAPNLPVDAMQGVTISPFQNRRGSDVDAQSPVPPDARVSADDSAAIIDINMKICELSVSILLLFSQGDSWVKSQLAMHDLMKGLVRMLRPTPIDLLWHEQYAPTVVSLLKTIKNICMEAKALKVLEECGAIGVLVPLLACEGKQVLSPDVILALYGPQHNPMTAARPTILSTPAVSKLTRPLTRYTSAELSAKAQMAKEVQNAAMHTLFYLCRVNHPRQIIAVEHNIIPVLIKLSGGGVLKQLALPLLCELVYASPRTRELLWRVGGVAVYVDLLGEPYWQVPVLSAIHNWLQQEVDKVESVLLMPRSVQALYKLFRSSQMVTFTSILQSFIGLPTKSARLAACFAEHEMFLKELFRRLQMDDIIRNAMVLTQLLKLLGVLLDTGKVPALFITSLRVREVVQRFCEDTRVIVNQLAESILTTKLPSTTGETRSSSTS